MPSQDSVLGFFLGGCFGHEVPKSSQYMNLPVRWTWRDLNPRPLLCESSDLPLIYTPALGRGALPLVRERLGSKTFSSAS